MRHTSLLRSSCLALALGTLVGAVGAQNLGPSQVVVPTLPGTGAKFGTALTVDGSRLVVGAPEFDVPNDGGSIDRAGTAFVYELSSEFVWELSAEIRPSLASVAGFAGKAVAVRGEVAFVGAPGSDQFGNNRGAVHVFARQGPNVWMETQVLPPPTPGTADGFGAAIAIDGDQMVVSAPARNRAFVFACDSLGVWSPTFEIEAPPGVTGFGRDLALAGERAVIGSDSGFAGAFEHVGPDWNHVSTFLADAALQTFGFGTAVEISPDGEQVYVGSPNASTFGAVLVYDHLSDSLWSSPSVLNESTAEGGFGAALATDGEQLLVGVVPKPGSFASGGRSFVYDRRTDGTWLRSGLLALGSGTANFARAISAGRAIVGAGSGTNDFKSYETGLLRANTLAVSTLNGGSQNLWLRAGSEHAWHFFVLLGSASGIGNGTALPNSPLVLPLAFDAYTSFVLESGPGLLTYWLGPLDANGNAISTFTVPPQDLVPLTGARLHHAYFVIDPTTFEIDAVSNPLPVELGL